MSRKNKIIIAATIIITILAIFLIVWSLGQKEPPANQNTNQPTVNKPLPLPLTNTNGNVNLPQNPTESKVQSSLLATALTFAEKYGSFSNQAGFENLQDLKVMMTPKMVQWTDNYIATNVKSQDGATYLGYSTKALSANINYQINDQAEVKVLTQRSESRGSEPKPRVFYQNLVLQFINVNGAWQVDNATWQ